MGNKQAPSPKIYGAYRTAKKANSIAREIWPISDEDDSDSDPEDSGYIIGRREESKDDNGCLKMSD